MTEEVEKRLTDELNTIRGMGFVDYFLIVWDYVKFARDHGIAVGPGRGSAAGSVVSYSLGITDLDPLKYNLIFERFLNPERVTAQTGGHRLCRWEVREGPGRSDHYVRYDGCPRCHT